MFLMSLHNVFVHFQVLESQVTLGEEELASFKKQAEETEGNLRQTVDQLNEVSSGIIILLNIQALCVCANGLMIFSALD